MKQFYPYGYLWEHPEKYNRIEVEDMKSSESTVQLCEQILKGLNKECGDLTRMLRLMPKDDELHRKARRMYDDLRSDEITTISFGVSNIMAQKFRNECPEGVF